MVTVAVTAHVKIVHTPRSTSPGDGNLHRLAIGALHEDGGSADIRLEVASAGRREGICDLLRQRMGGVGRSW